MDIHLSPELEQLVHQKVQTGRYGSAVELVGEALRLLDERDQLGALYNEEIHKKVSQGLESLRLGKGVDGETAFDRLEAQLADLERNGRP